MNKYPDLKEFAKIFMIPNKNHAEIDQLGHYTLEVIYGCMPGNTLDFERATRFSNKVVSSSARKPMTHFRC